MNERKDNHENRFSLKLSTLFICLTLFALLFGWFADHRKLKSQIPEPKPKLMVAYAVSNASPDVVATRLNELYPQRTIVAAPPNGSAEKFVLVNVEKNVHDQISIIIQHLDRPATDMVKLQATPENDTLKK